MVLRNERTGDIVATQVALANNFITRGIGLLRHPAVGADEGLWITGCSSVHTLGMRATIDLFFVDKAGRVLRIVAGAVPNRLVFACRGASAVVELGAAEDATRGVQLGDRLLLE
jgi:uncharacterized membrane protein (UPF0127 family)